MSDEFERRLSDSLRQAADGATADATGLAQGARSRLRRRRRTTIAAVVAALVVVAVPVGIQLASGDGDDGGTVATDPAEDEGPAMRTESWRDATVEVPADWGYGALSAWCASGKGDEPLPVVQRPTTIMPMIACSDPANSYGVQFVDARVIMVPSNEEVPAEVADEGEYPAGAWSGYKVVGGTMVQVVAPDEETATAIYDSIELLEGPDANGCPLRLSEAEAAESEGGDAISLCRYGDPDELASSRLLSADDSATLLDELEKAPTQDEGADCLSDAVPSDPTIVLQGGGYLATVRTDDPCPSRSGVFLSGTVHEVTDGIRELVQMP